MRMTSHNRPGRLLGRRDTPITLRSYGRSRDRSRSDRSSLEPALDGRSAQVQPRPREVLSNLSAPRDEHEHLALLHERGHEIRKLVHGLADLHERISSVFVATILPVGDGGGGDEKSPRGLGDTPPARCGEHQDFKALDGSVVGPPSRRQPAHARVFQLQLLLSEQKLALEPLVLTLQSRARQGAVLGPAAHEEHRGPDQPERMQEGGAHVPGPVLGQRDGLLSDNGGTGSTSHARALSLAAMSI
jgi:hypothetical protein